MSLLSPNNTDLSWYARGGRHNSYNPCEGTAVKGIIDMNSTVGWEKEIWQYWRRYKYSFESQSS